MPAHSEIDVRWTGMQSAALRLLAAVVVSAAALAGSRPASAAGSRQSVVEWSASTLENHFPISLTFRVHVKAEAEIVAATLYQGPRNTSSVERHDLPIASASELDLEYRWVTERTLAIPSTPIVYHWEVTLASGETVSSPEELAWYDDARFEWVVREFGNLSIWTHDRGDQLGARALVIASRALEEQEQLFNIRLEFPIRVIIYNTPEEFAAWHPSSTELIGGEAFPELGITTQIVSNRIGQESWLNEVLPHEISHLYFFQASYHALSAVPQWVDEGVAQYNEVGTDVLGLEQARLAALVGRYIPLRALAGGFGEDEGKFRLAYAESLSAVSYLIDAHGEAGLSRLLAAYKSGKPTAQAFPDALGVTVEEFEQQWLASLGVPEGMYPTPAPTATMLSIPAWKTALASGALTPSATAPPAPRPSPPATAETTGAGSPPTLYVCGVPMMIVAIAWANRMNKRPSPRRPTAS